MKLRLFNFICTSRIIFLCVEIFFATPLYSQSFLFQGASPTYESGLSQTNTRGAVAVANNPANTLITRKKQAYADACLLSVNYVYSRSEFAPAKIEKIAPPINFGASFKPKSNFAIGLFFTPRPALSADKITAVPQAIGGEPFAVDVETKSTTFITAIGAAYKVDKMTSIGLSLIETAEDRQIIVRQTGTTDDASAIFGMRYRGSSTQFLLGFRSLVDSDLTVAGSLRTPVEKTYKGSLIVKGDEDNFVKKKGFSPMVVAVGGEYKLGVPAVFSELRYEMWSKGKDSTASGIPGSPSSTALNDVFILVGGGRLRLPNAQSASASLGIYPANVGNGSTSEQLKVGGGSNGVQFGEFDALDRMMFSASYRMSSKRRDLTAGFNFISGSRNVSAEYPGAGRYSLMVLTIGGGGSFYF